MTSDRCCLGLSPEDCATTPSRHCDGLQPDIDLTNPHADLIRRLGEFPDDAGAFAEAIAALSAPVTLAQAMSCPEVETYTLEWIAGARPPLHPEPMKGRHAFPSMKEAMQFFSKLANDASFVLLTKTTLRKLDVSASALVVLAAMQVDADPAPGNGADDGLALCKDT